jgi:hypothetical protein
MLTSSELTKLERAALHRAIAKVAVPAWRDGLLRQVDSAHATARTTKTTGYYVDFDVAPTLRIADLPDDFNKTPPEAEAHHSDGSNAVFFIVYVKNGVIAFMEASSTGDWPDNEDEILFDA